MRILKTTISLSLLFIAIALYSGGDDEFVDIRPTITQTSSYQSELNRRNDRRNRIESSVFRYVKARSSDPLFPEANSSDENAKEISVAVMSLFDTHGVDPWFIVGLMRVENPWLDPDIINGYGAVGLAQVVPRFHWGNYPKCGTESLLDVYTNLCYGVSIYKDYLRMCRGDSECALWRYNGCTAERRKRNESCQNYPLWIASRSDEFVRNYIED